MFRSCSPMRRNRTYFSLKNLRYLKKRALRIPPSASPPFSAIHRITDMSTTAKSRQLNVSRR